MKALLEAMLLYKHQLLYDNHLYIYIYIYIYIYRERERERESWPTVIEGDAKAPFSIATTMRFRRGLWIAPLTLDPYLIVRRHQIPFLRKI